MELNKWLRIFVQKPIIAQLSKYLTLEDWFVLSSTCKYMHDSWINSDFIDAINMRKLVYDAFKWKYTKTNPFRWVRKYATQDKSKTFRCMGGCGKKKKSTKLINLKLSQRPQCAMCWCKASSFQYREEEYIMQKMYRDGYTAINNASWRHAQMFELATGESVVKDGSIYMKYYHKHADTFELYEHKLHRLYILTDVIDKNVDRDVEEYRAKKAKTQ